MFVKKAIRIAVYVFLQPYISLIMSMIWAQNGKMIVPPAKANVVKPRLTSIILEASMLAASMYET